MKNLVSLIGILVLMSGCSKYMIYETPYCIESVIIPPPESIEFDNSVNIEQLPCDSIRCREFIVDYQQGEIKTYDSISNWIGEAELRIEQYERRVALCKKANEKTQELIRKKVKEAGEENVTVHKIKVDETQE